MSVQEQTNAGAAVEPIKVRTDDCLNRRHRGSHCDLCLACPVAAIGLQDGLPRLDSSRCVGCGLCIAVCPTDVYRTEGSSDSTILESLKRWDVTEVACERRENLETTRAPRVQGAARVNCLARLLPELLTAFAAEHSEVWLDDSLCSACPIGSARESILRAANASRELLAAWQRQGRIKLYTESADSLAAPHPFPVQPATRYTRRDFLSLLSLNVGKLAAAAVTSSLPDDSTPPPPNVQPRVATLTRALARLGAPEQDVRAARLVTIQVDDRCTACGLCARICPTRAIHFEEGTDRYSLSINAVNCLGTECRLCERICIPNALAVHPGASRTALPSGTQLLRSGALAHCERCHLPFAATDSQTLCPECRSDKKHPFANRY